MSSQTQKITPAKHLHPSYGAPHTLPAPKRDHTPWQREARQIYDGYSIYHQSGGTEQSVFTGSTGTLRSDAILAALSQQHALRPTGRLLDVGCGNGAFLRACSRALPGWSTSGLEVSNNKHQSTIESIPGVEKLYVGSLDDVKGEFDLISMIHVLEHIPEPQTVLRSAQRHLAPRGLLLIEVPDCLENPFMMLVADHCSHFSLGDLPKVVAASGYDVLTATGRWVSREISLVATPSPGGPHAGLPVKSGTGKDIASGTRWLEQVVQDASKLVHSHAPFGIFGTSIAGTWLHAQLDGAAAFFVDEDPSRIGRTHLGKAILGPDKIPDGAAVFLALPDPGASAIARRLQRPGVTFYSPGQGVMDEAAARPGRPRARFPG